MHALSPTATTILLISATEQRRITLAQQLEALGYSVIAIPDSETLADVLKISKYDLLIVDLHGISVDRARDLSERAAELLAQGVPVLTLNAQQPMLHESWTQETLGHRVSTALRNRNSTDVLTERQARWDGLNVLDPETQLFSRRYFDALFPIEIERARRVHQPLSTLLIEIHHVQPSLTWQAISARLLSSLRQTDMVVRYTPAIVLVVLPVTEGPIARAVAARLLKSLSFVDASDGTSVQASIGIAVYPAHGATPETIISAAQQALSRTVLGSQIVSFDQM